MKTTSEKIAFSIGLIATLTYGFLLLLTHFIPELSIDVFGSYDVTLAVVGTVIAGANTANRPDARVVPDISTILTKVEPDRHPLNVMLRNLRSEEPAYDKKVGWEEVTHFPRQLTVNGATTLGTAGQAKDVTVDANASHFIKGDVCMVLDATTGADATGWDGKRLYVVSGSGTTLSVRAIDSTGFISQVPVIPDNSLLVRFSSAKSETEATGTPRGMQPTTLYNYVHTFEKVIEISRLSQKIKTFTANDYKRNIAQAMRDFAEDIEYTLFFGIGSETTNPENSSEKQYTMNGAEHYVTTNVFAPSTLSGIGEDDLLDWVRRMTSDVHSSSTKILFADPLLMGQLAKLNLVSTQLQTKRSETVLGTKVNRITTPFGVDLLLKLHKGFHAMGKKGYGFILDPANVRRRTLEKMYKMDLDIEKSGGRRVIAKKIVETSTVEFRNEGSHGFIQAVDPNS